MKQSSYSEKLKDPRWQRLRLEILNRDKFTCQICSATDKTLHVHHPHYSPEYQNPWEYDDYLLLTLCETCHSNEGDALPELKNYLLCQIVRMGFNTSAKMGTLLDILNEIEVAGAPGNPNFEADKNSAIEYLNMYWENQLWDKPT